MKKFKIWWCLHITNPVVREGHTEAFKWVFRRFWLEISTTSGNWKVRFTAAENPYAYLLACKSDDNIIGYCQMLYYLGMVITTDQGLVNDIQKAVSKYGKRLEKKAASMVKDDETEEQIDLAEVKAAQAFAELPKAEQKKVERGIDGRFRRVEKKIEREE